MKKAVFLENHGDVRFQNAYEVHKSVRKSYLSMYGYEILWGV